MNMPEESQFPKPDRDPPPSLGAEERETQMPSPWLDPTRPEPVLRAEDLPATELTPRAPHPGFWWSLLWCLGYLVVTQLIPALFGGMLLVVMLMLRPGGLDAAKLGNVQAVLDDPAINQVIIPIFLLAEILSILFSWLVVRLIVGREWPRILALRWPGFIHVILALIGLPGLIFLTTALDAAARQYLPSFLNLESMMKMVAGWPTSVAVLIIGLGPGIGEELWCRGFLGRGFVGRYGVGGGVLLTSLAFGVLHLEPRQVVYASFMGVLLHLTYLATRSLLVPVMLHTFNNSLSVLADRFTEITILNKPAEQLPWQLFAAAALLVAAVGWALYKSRARLLDLPSKEGFPWRPAFPGVAYPPPDSSTIVVRPRPDPASWCIVIMALLVFAESMCLAM
jgi:membrane protease YdiL (CAAX protease family)